MAARIGRPPSCTCGTCPKCKRAAYMREWYRRKTPEERRVLIARRDPEVVRANDRARYERDRSKRRAAMDEYVATHREQINASKKAYTRKHPERKRATTTLNNAVRDGRIMKGPCERRGDGGCSGRVHGHHDDYSKPLEVQWLCAVHHARHHVELREGARG